MIKQMNGWKVLRENRTSFTGYCNSHGIKYPVGVIVSPSLSNSCLLFFKNKEDAKRFAGCGFVVPCIAYNACRIKYLAYAVRDMESFWKKRANKKKMPDLYRDTAPKGTWAAKSIQCME